MIFRIPYRTSNIIKTRLTQTIPIPAFVIGLDRHWDTRGSKTMLRLLESGHTDIRRWDAIDGFSPKSLDIFSRMNIIKKNGIKHTLGERGCSASHLQLMNFVVHNRIPRVVVYEDDAQPCDRYTEYLPDILTASEKYDLVLIGHMNSRPGSCRDPIVVPGISYAMHAYTYTYNGALKIINDCANNPWIEPIDMTLGQYSKSRIGLRRGIANHKSASQKITFNGIAIPNIRSNGFVAQDHALLSSIKSFHLETWKR